MNKKETIIRLPDSPNGRKRFRVLENGKQYGVGRALHPAILGPGGPKVGQSITRFSSKLYDSKGIEARETFSKRKRARIRYWGANRNPQERRNKKR